MQTPCQTTIRGLLYSQLPPHTQPTAGPTEPRDSTIITGTYLRAESCVYLPSDPNKVPEHSNALPHHHQLPTELPCHSRSHPHTPHSRVSCRMSAGRTGQRRMLFYDCMMSMMPPSSMDHNATLNATQLVFILDIPSLLPVTPSHTSLPRVLSDVCGTTRAVLSMLMVSQSSFCSVRY